MGPEEDAVASRINRPTRRQRRTRHPIDSGHAPSCRHPRRCRASCSRAGACSLSVSSSSRPSRSCTSCCPSSSASRRRGTGSSTGTSGGSAVAARARGLLVRGYVALFRAVFVRGESRIDWRASYQITMAGLAATRLFAAGGAGGIALTAWALRRSGMEARVVACRMIAFLALLYGVYMATLVIVRPRALHSASSPAVGAVRDHGGPGDLRRRCDRHLPRRVAAARRLRPPRGTLARRRRQRPRPPDPPGGGGPGRGGDRRAHRDRPGPRAQPVPARRDRLVGIRHRRAVGVLSRLRRRRPRPR